MGHGECFGCQALENVLPWVTIHLRESEPEVSDILAENLQAIVISRSSGSSNFVNSGDKSEGNIKNDRILPLVGPTEINLS